MKICVHNKICNSILYGTMRIAVCPRLPGGRGTPRGGWLVVWHMDGWGRGPYPHALGYIFQKNFFTENRNPFRGGHHFFYKKTYT